MTKYPPPGSLSTATHRASKERPSFENFVNGAGESNPLKSGVSTATSGQRAQRRAHAHPAAHVHPVIDGALAWLSESGVRA